MMTAEEIDTIRNLRAFAVPWTIVARQMDRTIEECRAAIGLPQYEPAERQPLPWDQKQRSLFPE